MAYNSNPMSIDFSSFNNGISKLMKKMPEEMIKALEIAGIQFMTWCNQGSPKQPAKPPIRFGVLRGSSSVFVNSKLISVYNQQIKQGAKDIPTPNKSQRTDKFEIVVGWNTDYASKMHEWTGHWGPFTQQDGDAGNKWAEKHLKSDKEALISMITIDFKKRVGL